MSYMQDGYYTDTVAASPPNVRAAFIRRTYLHLAVAIAALVGIEAVLLQLGLGLKFLASMRQAGGGAWIALMVAFIGGGYLAQYMARSSNSVGTQYMGLTMYVLLEAVILLPILTFATEVPQFAGKNLPLQAGILTLIAFGALTAAVFVSKKDFSFLGPVLWVASWLLLGFVIVAVIFGGFSFGLGITVFGLILAAGFILYDTSNVMHHYGPNQHVAASLELFASVALMFYYVLRLLMITSNND